MCVALHYLFDNILLIFGLKLYRRIVGISISSCCRFVLFCFESDFMLSLSDNIQIDIIEAFIFTSRYLNDCLNIDNPSSEQMLSQIYPTEVK